MELFTLGADRGAYTEQDVRELARALTGFDFDWSDELGMHNFRYVAGAPRRRAARPIFGQTGAFDWEQGVATVRAPPAAPVASSSNKLWSYFIPTPPSDVRPAGARVALRVERLPGAAGARGDPAPPRPPHRRAHGEAARRVPGRACCGCSSGAVDGEHWVWYCARARASGSSTRRTCPAGTTRAGSTRARCAGASSVVSRAHVRPRTSTATRSTTTTRPRRPRRRWPRRAPGRATRT